MGVVYAAFDRVLSRAVAVKVLDFVDVSGEAGRRLQGEARILGRLEHPGIVPVHDAGTLPDGRVFYVMKLVRGERLDVALDTARSLAERLELFLRICNAVSFAHAQGIVHRDLKPENVMLGRFGEVLVMDWGVAKEMASPVVDHAVVGTPGFMAPEQTRHAASVDARADVFALGVILGAMMSSPAPKALAAIATCARADVPGQRYDSVQALAADVVAFREGAPVSAYRERIMERLARVYGRYRAPILLVLAYMVMRVVLLLWMRA
ncbi:MAG: serine/threonine protein kinase [Acidobacteria bacterium]|nr:serine/threonine protein kinase [Acidobacteriota bacterium]